MDINRNDLDGLENMKKVNKIIRDMDMDRMDIEEIIVEFMKLPYVVLEMAYDIAGFVWIMDRYGIGYSLVNLNDDASYNYSHTSSDFLTNMYLGSGNAIPMTTSYPLTYSMTGTTSASSNFKYQYDSGITVTAKNKYNASIKYLPYNASSIIDCCIDLFLNVGYKMDDFEFLECYYSDGQCFMRYKILGEEYISSGRNGHLAAIRVLSDCVYRIKMDRFISISGLIGDGIYNISIDSHGDKSIIFKDAYCASIFSNSRFNRLFHMRHSDINKDDGYVFGGVFEFVEGEYKIYYMR